MNQQPLKETISKANAVGSDLFNILMTVIIEGEQQRLLTLLERLQCCP